MFRLWCLHRTQAGLNISCLTVEYTCGSARRFCDYQIEIKRNVLVTRESSCEIIVPHPGPYLVTGILLFLHSFLSLHRRRRRIEGLFF